jgi:hypothetical protein
MIAKRNSGLVILVKRPQHTCDDFTDCVLAWIFDFDNIANLHRAVCYRTSLVKTQSVYPCKHLDTIQLLHQSIRAPKINNTNSQRQTRKQKHTKRNQADNRTASRAHNLIYFG